MIRKYLSILLAIVVVFVCMIPCSAVSAREKDFLSEMELPSDFSFSVQDRCSSHPYFHHALAQSDGKVAVFSHYIDPQGKDPETFTRQYVDIYHEDGSFAKEFSFCTQHTYALALENDRLYLYFYSYAVTIDLETEEVRCYDIQDAYVNDQSDVLLQQPETFRSGKWEYRCKKTLNGYNVLIRSDGVTEQAIVEMSGKVLPTWHYIGVAVGAVAISLVVLRNRKRRKCS